MERHAGEVLGRGVRRAAQATSIRKRGSDATMLLIVNAHHDVVLFHAAARGSRTTSLAEAHRHQSGPCRG